MVVKFPEGWSSENKPCQICLRGSVKEGAEENIYYGCIGSKKCEKCGRFCCELHFNNEKQLCYDCWSPEVKR